MEKATPKPLINYYIINRDNRDQEMASELFEFISEGDEAFSMKVYTDFTRHDGLHSYS
jgi:hypothetical protein